MALITGKPTSVNLGGVDLSGFVADAGFELTQDSELDACPAATGLTQLPPLVFVGTLDALPSAVLAWLLWPFEVRKRRLSRMRAAYRARRR